MYPESGPSRSGPSYAPSKSTADPGQPPRQGRWEGDYRDERGSGYGSTPNRPFPPRRPNWPSDFRPSGSRSRTPSPPRRYDRDGPRPYDRERPEPEWRSGSGRIPTPRERDWERDRDRRWNDRDRRDDRFRERDEPRPLNASQGPSPPDRATRSPSFGPRRSVPANTSTPYRIPSGPRSLTATPNGPNGSTREYRAFPGRDLGTTMDNATAGPGPTTLAQTPRAPRSMRGSSSPVETKRLRNDTHIPSTVPTSTVPLPVDVKEEQDLEEGEVLSPVKSVRSSDWRPEYDRRDNYDRDDRAWHREGDRDRWSTSRRNGPYKLGRGSISPQKRRSRSPPYLNGKNYSDKPWGEPDRDRSRSSPIDRRRVVSDGDAAVAKSREADEFIPSAPERPLTPIEPPPRTEGSALSLQIPELKTENGSPGAEPPFVKPPSGPAASSQIDKEELTNVPPTRPDTPLDAPPTEPKESHASRPPSSLTVETTLPIRPNTPAGPPSTDAKDLPLRPETPALPPPSPIDPPVQVDVKMRSPSPPAVGAELPVQSNAEVVQANTVSAETAVESVAEDVKGVAPSLPQQAVTETYLAEEAISSTSVVSSSDVQLAMTAPVPLQEVKDAVSTIEEPSPPTPNAPTSPSENAVTPAFSNRQPTDVEIVIAHSEHEETGPMSLDMQKAIISILSPPMLPTDTARRVTIAERRSVALPPNDGPLSSPFGDKSPRRDPQPTADSMMESTDAETEYGPRTAEIEMDAMSDVSESVMEEARQINLITAVKAAQAKAISLDLNKVNEWNHLAAPTESSRVEDLSAEQRDDDIRQITRTLADDQVSVAKLVALTVVHEQLGLQRKIESLKREYHELNTEWKEHCDYLDALMEKRGPPPADLYATPNALPIVAPAGPAPTTPIDETFGARGNRRRGVGDAVTTEAEFEAILAGLADTAAKDPNFRASKTTAVVPDMLLDHERNMTYDDDNDLVTDPLSFYDYAGNAEPIWTAEERATFLKRYLAHPKQFGKIADHLPEKTASDCVLFYYRTKKTVDYKGMLASRRGDKKKKGMTIKKGGKSSALLSNLDRQKPTINSATTPGPRSAITPAKQRDGNKAGRVSKDAVVTPGVDGIARRRKGDDDDGIGSSAGPSRAGSEGPSAMKSKMKMTIKTAKRPRVSSITMANADGTTTAVPTNSALSIAGETGMTPTATPGSETAPIIGPDGNPLTPADLLPPVKRAGKRRKVDSTDGSIVEDPSTPRDPNKPRRPATNSYWSVEERKKFRDLVAVHGNNHKAIADELQNKSERQVSNFWDSHKLEFESIVDGKDTKAWDHEHGSLGSQRRPSSGYGQPAPFARSIYDVYPDNAGRRDNFEQNRFNEPRLGMFPPSPHLAPPSLAALPPLNPETKPLPPIRTGGGMRISALLNNDGVEAKAELPPIASKSYEDAASDGTVSERDGENGTTRPSPRSLPPVPYPAGHEERRGSYYDRTEYRSAPVAPQLHDRPTYYSAPPPSAATATPSLPPFQHRNSHDQGPPQGAPPPPHPYSHPHGPPPPERYDRPWQYVDTPEGMYYRRYN